MRLGLWSIFVEGEIYISSGSFTSKLVKQGKTHGKVRPINQLGEASRYAVRDYVIWIKQLLLTRLRTFICQRNTRKGIPEYLVGHITRELISYEVSVNICVTAVEEVNIQNQKLDILFLPHHRDKFFFFNSST